MTILITTHSMEKADALCSRIAIMTKKGLQCIGDQIHLKNKYGKGFLLSIALNDSISDVCGYVKTHICPQAEFLEVKLNIHTFTILKEKVDLSNLILQIMKLQKDKIVTYWSVNESSLSDVFFDDMTVEEHLTLVAKLHCVKRSAIDRICKEKAEAVGLSHNAYKRKSSKLSGGQKRHLTLGMALMSQPQILFLDEPTVGFAYK